MRFCGVYYIKTMQTYCVSCKKNIAKKIKISEKLNEIDWCFYQKFRKSREKFKVR